MVGRSQDIAQVIDPDTGQAVSGRMATVVLHQQDIVDQGYPGMPEGVPDTSKKPWVVQFDDERGNTHTFKVSECNPDNALCDVVLHLEVYKLP
jgi:hypothetical protein